MRVTKDLLAGAMFVTFGVGGALIARNYTVGTISQMGSGYFPFMIGGLISVLGLFILIRAIIWPELSEEVATIQVRPVVFISAAIIAFGFIIDRLGVIAAIAALIVIGRFAGREGTALEVAAMVVALCAVVIGIFVYGLGIRLHLGPF